MRTFSCARVNLFCTLLASFPALTPFPTSAMFELLQVSKVNK